VVTVLIARRICGEINERRPNVPVRSSTQA